MELPNRSNAIIPQRKLTGYLLALDHPKGAAKARFFHLFGFTLENWTALAEALAQHARKHTVAHVEQRLHGTIYVIDGDMLTPSGRSVFV